MHSKVHVCLSVQLITLGLLLFVFSPFTRSIPTLGELALLGTVYGDKYCPEKTTKARAITDDSHKSMAIFRYLLGITRKPKKMNVVELAKSLCFFSFPSSDRFGLDLEGKGSLPGYGPDAAVLLKKLFSKFQSRQKVESEEILALSKESVALHRAGKKIKTGSYSNGSCMASSAVVTLLDRFPALSDEEIAIFATQIAEITHNHEQGRSAAKAMALTAKYCAEFTKEKEIDFNHNLLSYLNAHINETKTVECLEIIKNNIRSKKSHSICMRAFNEKGPSSKESKHKLAGTWAPNSAAAAIYFLLACAGGAQAQMRDEIRENVNDQDTIGAMAMSLRVLKDGGFIGIDEKEVQSCIDEIPGCIQINRQLVNYMKEVPK